MICHHEREPSSAPERRPDVEGLPRFGPPETRAEREARLIAEIQTFVTMTKEQRIAGSLGRDELANLGGSIDRLVRIRNIQIEGLAWYCRKHSNVEVVIPIYALILWMCDAGPSGTCYLSVSRIAEFYGRHENTVSAAIKRLVDRGMLHEQKRIGQPSIYWPVYGESTDVGSNLHIFVKALAPPSIKKAGRPRKASGAAAEIPPQRACGGNSGNTPTTQAELPPQPCTVDDSSLSLCGRDARAASDCWFDDEGRVQVANGFKDELLELAGGDEVELRRLLDIAGGFVGTEVNPLRRRNCIRSSVTKELADRQQRDRRYQQTVASRGRQAPSSSKAGALVGIRNDATGAPFDPRVMAAGWWDKQVQQHLVTGGRWPAEYGPPPGQPGFLGPESALRETQREAAS